MLKNRTPGSILVNALVFSLCFIGIGSTLRLPLVLGPTFLAGAITGIWSMGAGVWAENEFLLYRERRAEREAARSSLE